MTYQVAFGMDTESLEDPDQLVLVTLPDECTYYDNDGLIDYIGNNDVDAQPMVGLTDVIESIRLAMQAEGVDDSTADRVIATLTDAVVNNVL